jgi:hypothetical protein
LRSDHDDRWSAISPGQARRDESVDAVVIPVDYDRHAERFEGEPLPGEVERLEACPDTCDVLFGALPLGHRRGLPGDALKGGGSSFAPRA